MTALALSVGHLWGIREALALCIRWATPSPRWTYREICIPMVTIVKNLTASITRL